MPTNFELTFTQPLLAQLDLGRIGGAQGYARAITNAYVRTLLTGLPAGSVPIVLPAPGLNAIAPPPFPIPAIPINNFDRRKRVMERILKTYFQAREFLPVRSNITETYRAIRGLLTKGKILKAELRRLTNEARQLSRDLRDLPKTLEEIKTAVILLIERERDRVELLYKGLYEFQVSVDPDAFQTIFQRELLLIDTIRNFRVTLNPSSFEQLINILNGLETELNAIPDIATEDDEQAVLDIKIYIRRQVLSILQRIVAIGNSLVAPEDYIDFYRDLVEEDVNLQPILVTVERYKQIKELLEPQIEKLERKKRDLLIKIRQTVTDKLAELKNHLRERIKANAAKRDSKGKRAQFVTAARTIQNTKKKYLSKIRMAKSVLRDTQSIIASTTSIIQKTTAFPAQMELLYINEIERYVEPPFQGIRNLGSSINVNNLTTPITINPTQGIQDVGVEAEQLEAEINAYFERSNINDPIIRKIFTKQIVTKLPSIDHFIEMFESKSTRLLQPFLEVVSINNDIVQIERSIKNIKKTLSANKPKSTPRYEPPQFIGPELQEISLYEMIRYYMDTIKLRVEKIQKDIRKAVAEVRAKIAEVSTRLISDVKDQLILLVPIKSDIVDKKNKVAIIKNKRDKIRDRKNQLIKRIRQIKYGVRAVRSFTSVARNLSQRKLRYTENSSAINTLIDSIYEIKILDAGSASTASTLRKEQAKKKTDISDYYYGLELLFDLYLEIKRVLKEGTLLKELKLYVETQVNTIFINDYRILYNQLVELSKLSDDPKELLKLIFSTNFNLRIFEESHIRTLLFQLEDAFLGDIKVKYNLIAENSFVKRTFVREQAYPSARYETEPVPTGTRKVFIIKPFEESMIARAVAEIFNFLRKILDFFKRELYDKLLKPLIDKIKEKINKIKESIAAELKVWLQRQANIDAKLMTIAFNLATRAFWTGFSWTSPNAVRYTCLSIGPFLPLTVRPDEGSSGLIRQISTRLRLQLAIMNGLVSPPPPTGIPPFPFIGYR